MFMKNYDLNFFVHNDYILGNISRKRLSTFVKIEQTENFIETGTYKGDGVSWALTQNYFNKIFSTELHPGLFEASKQLFIENKKVSIYNEDTVVFLKNILPTITSPTTIYLDAHISGSDTTCNPSYPIPLLQETQIILNNFKNLNKLIVIVDDERLWSEELINELISLYKSKGMLSVYLDDSIVFCDSYWLKS